MSVKVDRHYIKALENYKSDHLLTNLDLANKADIALWTLYAIKRRRIASVEVTKRFIDIWVQFPLKDKKNKWNQFDE